MFCSPRWCTIDSQETGTSCVIQARICDLRLEEYLLSDMKHSLKMGPKTGILLIHAC